VTAQGTLPVVYRERLAALAGDADARPVWPEASWDVLRQSGALGWTIPRAYGGLEWTPRALLAGYEQLAGACLTTAFLLSQREAACRRLLESGRETLCRELLPALASGKHFATVGLSQLTTSRQHTAPALRVLQAGTALVLDGVIPWVTGAAGAQHIIIGAALDDGRQVLAVMPTDLPGVSVGPPLELMALQGSVTAEVRCDGVRLDRDLLLAGPAERVVQSGRGGTGGLETSCLALGLAGAAIDELEHEAARRPELVEVAESLRQQHGEVREELFRLADPAPDGGGKGRGEDAAALRARSNTLVLSATQAALTAAKGTGFLLSHPAQRRARQALFFLVWSCPWPAAAATLARLTAAQPPSCS
jgi:alkylation response protein AidB-like acyl-CoA dehydrogenase